MYHFLLVLQIIHLAILIFTIVLKIKIFYMDSICIIIREFTLFTIQSNDANQ